MSHGQALTDLTRPWQQTDLPAESTTLQVESQRPSDSRHASERPEPAEQVVVVRRQNRHRLVEGDGITVVEKQEVVFTETKTTWSSAGVDTVKHELGEKDEPAVVQG